jgi:hypothetical protein
MAPVPSSESNTASDGVLLVVVFEVPPTEVVVEVDPALGVVVVWLVVDVAVLGVVLRVSPPSVRATTTATTNTTMSNAPSENSASLPGAARLSGANWLSRASLSGSTTVVACTVFDVPSAIRNSRMAPALVETSGLPSLLY